MEIIYICINSIGIFALFFTTSYILYIIINSFFILENGIRRNYPFAYI